MNCWEFTKCGREPGGPNSRNGGACCAATNATFNGYNGGLNAGRACWLIQGTRCDNDVQGTFVEKAELCRKCRFYQTGSAGSDFLLRPDQICFGADDSKQPYVDRNISSKTDDERVILYLFEQLSKRDDSRMVSLVTPYKELPISSKGEIWEVKSSSVIISASELQIAAINASRETLIGTGHLPTFFLGRILDYDIRKSTVTLTNLSYADFFMNFRKTVRVRLPKPMSVVMHAGNSKVSGVIQDISHGGCCMSTLTKVGLDGTEEVSLKLKLFDPSTSQVLEADVPCVVTKIANASPPFRVALRFNHNAKTEQLVGTFITYREMEIVKELRASI